MRRGSNLKIAITLCLCLYIANTDAWSRRRRRRSPPPPVENTPPYVTKCPGNKYATAGPQMTTARVTWSESSDIGFADSGSGVQSVWRSAGLAPGSYFSEGSTTEAYSARDNAGNVCNNCCLFSVRVSVTRCPGMHHPSNGAVSCSHSNIYGSSCSFSCAWEYELHGPQSVSCQSNGAWNQAAPTCIEMNYPCPSPDISDHNVRVINNGECDLESGEPIPADTVCQYECKVGHTTHDSRIIHCHGTGEWSSDPPICQMITCDGTVVHAPENGYKDGCPGAVVEFGVTCTVGCIYGYEPTSPSKTTCLSDDQGNGLWNSSVITTCTEMNEPCPNPEIGEHRIIINEEECDWDSDELHPIGTVCQYECGVGYVLEGNSNITCFKTGEWTPDAPKCQVITCDSTDIPIPENGYKNGCSHSTVVYGVTCTVGCLHGHAPTTPSQATCVADEHKNGMWNSSVITSCGEIVCSPLDPPEHGYIMRCSHNGFQTNATSSQQLQATVCSAVCNEGYAQSGPTNRTCLATGMWNGNPVKCLAHCAPDWYRTVDNECAPCDEGYCQPDWGQDSCEICGEDLSTILPDFTTVEDLVTVLLSTTTVKSTTNLAYKNKDDYNP